VSFIAGHHHGEHLAELPAGAGELARRYQVVARPALIAALVALSAPLASRATPFQEENLIVSIPKGFQTVKEGDVGPMTIGEYVPQGETVPAWSRTRLAQKADG
jgi:hypothetical protein